jgi:ABC-type Fe3+ transport system permease subunit
MLGLVFALWPSPSAAVIAMLCLVAVVYLVIARQRQRLYQPILRCSVCGHAVSAHDEHGCIHCYCGQGIYLGM